MINIRLIAFFVLLFFIKTDDRVNIDIYTESLCPDCIRFIKTSFEQAINLKDFHTICNYRVLPYGNAQQEQKQDSWVFTCQHGENECYGNMMENCAKKYIPDKYYYVWLVCLENLATDDFDQSAQRCSALLQIDLTQTFNCLNSSEGIELQHEIADQTEKLTPPHTYVPWITVNGIHDLHNEGLILQNMIKFACDNYKGSIQLPGCGQNQINFQNQNSVCHRYDRFLM